MGIFFRNWLDEGYYEEDSLGDLTKIDNPEDIYHAKKNGKLFHNDGYSTSKIDDSEYLDLEK